MTPEQVREALADRNLKIVADAAGVEYHRLTAFMRGEVADPSYRMITRLIQYLEAKQSKEG